MFIDNLRLTLQLKSVFVNAKLTYQSKIVGEDDELHRMEGWIGEVLC